MTLLVGQNNAGKSRLLRAIALGLGGATPDRDDLTVGGEQPATIDLVIAPAARSEEQLFNDRVARKLGRDVQPISDEPIRERFGWRMSISPSKEGYGVRSESEVMTYDSIAGEWTVRANAPGLNNEQRSLISADLVDTRRDLVEEFSRRGSAIRRVLDDLEISPSARLVLESDLYALGTKIVDESGALAALRTALSSATDLVGGLGEPNVEPLPVRLEELARSVSINLSSRQGSLPLRFHGAGARSLASLQVQGVLYDRRIGRDGSALRPHAVSLVEEPESHLHPQAQLELPALLERIQGQAVVSTHSSHVATAADPLSVRILREADDRLHVVDLHASPDRRQRTSPAATAEALRRRDREAQASSRAPLR